MRGSRQEDVEQEAPDELVGFKFMTFGRRRRVVLPAER